MIFSGGDDNTIRVWDANKPAYKKILHGHEKRIASCVLAKDGRFLFSGADDGIKRWDWCAYQTHRVLKDGLTINLGSESDISYPPAGVEHTCISPDGKWALAARSDGRVNFWDLNQPSRVQRLGGSHAFLTGNIMFFERKPLTDTESTLSIMSSGGDNTTRLWDVQTRAQIHTFTNTGLRGIAVIAQNGTLCLTGSDSKSQPARAWVKQNDGSWLESITFKEMLREKQHELSEVTSIALSPCAKYGLLADKNGYCLLFSINQDTGNQDTGFTGLKHFAADEREREITKSVFELSLIHI